jgi:hypothetical protein
MIFYKIPATADHPARIEPTQDAARTVCRDRRPALPIGGSSTNARS